jgi:O-antigen ligase
MLLILTVWLCVLSYILYLSFLPDDSLKGANFGVFQLFVLAKAILLFYVTSRIPLPPDRVAVLKSVVTVVLVFASGSIIATFFNLLPVTAVAPHLPADPGVSGPWHRFTLDEFELRRGWGTLGYNHGFVAAHLLTLLGLSLYLAPRRNAIAATAQVCLAVVACFLSDSRSGFFSVLLFAAIWWLKKPISFAISLTCLVGLAAAAAVVFPGVSNYLLSSSDVQATVERQRVLVAANQPENLSGRHEIWVDRLHSLDEQPLRWILGSGFGSAVDARSTAAHMLPLQIISELGLIGLATFTVLFTCILRQLSANESGRRPLFWTTSALLVSSVTQETFYPVPAMGGFLGLYLCAVAIALNPAALKLSSSMTFDNRSAGSRIRRQTASSLATG